MDYRPEDIARMQILGEIQAELQRHMEAGQPVPATLAARTYRSLRETGDPEMHAKAEECRDILHDGAARGVPLAIETLELLADDPFWRGDVDSA
jgi:hypothetical protein